MECDRCGADAIHHAAYAGAHLCGEHLCRSVETRVKRRVRTDGLLDPEATPDDPDRWVVGLSGGKDSAVLTHILDDVFGRDPRVELLAVTIHEGIEGYRDASLDACLSLTADRSIRHEVVSYEDEFGVRMDDVAETDPENMAPCAYCGVFRRNVLERYAKSFDADKLLTGHNLDDEAQTALMNVLEGDVAQVAKHFDASLGPFDERKQTDAFVPRAKPLRDVPEQEVALYCHVADLPVHMATCPHAAEAYRGEIRSLLHDLETNHPGTRHSIMAGYEELSALVADRYRGPVSDNASVADDSTADDSTADGSTADDSTADDSTADGSTADDSTADDSTADGSSAGASGATTTAGIGAQDGRSLRECERCGSTTSRPVCRACRLLESIEAV